MSIAITCTPTAPVSKTSVCRINVTGASSNDATAYSTSIYPTEPQIKYYLSFVVGGVEKGRSAIFAPNPHDGSFIFNNYIFPSSGSYTIHLAKAANDADAATQAVTVS